MDLTTILSTVGGVTGLIVLDRFGVLDKILPAKKNGNGNGNGNHVDLTPIVNEIKDVGKKVEHLTGRVDERFRSDEGYHQAIVNNHKELVEKHDKLNDRVVSIEEHHKFKKEFKTQNA